MFSIIIWFHEIKLNQFLKKITLTNVGPLMIIMTKLIFSRNSLDNFWLHVLLIKLLKSCKTSGFFSCSLVKFTLNLRVNSKGQLDSPYRRDFRVDVGILSRIGHVNAELARYPCIILLIRIVQLLKVISEIYDTCSTC